MAIVTLKGHVSRALDFYNKDSIYFKIGKTTSWVDSDRSPDQPTSDVVDDNNPPWPTVTSEIDDVLGFKKVEGKFLVKPDDNGTLVYRDTKWKIYQPTEGYDNGCRWVYVTATISYEELPVDKSYRQIGIVTGVVPKEGIPVGKYNLLPSEVIDEGVLEVLNNRKPIIRSADLRETLNMVVEF